MMIHCFSCKRPTNTTNAHQVMTNGRARVSGTCAVCHKKKSSFVGRTGSKVTAHKHKGKGIGDNIADVLGMFL